MYERFVFSDRQMWFCRYVSFFFLNTQNARNTNYNSAYFVGVFVRIKDDNPYNIPFMMPGTHLDAQSVVSSLSHLLQLTALLFSPHWNNSRKDPIDHHVRASPKCSISVYLMSLSSCWYQALHCTWKHSWCMTLLYPYCPPTSLASPLFFSFVLWPPSLLPEKMVFEFLCSVHWRSLSYLVYSFAWYWVIYLWHDFSLGFHVSIFQLSD